MPFFEVTKIRSETLHVEANDLADAISRAHEAEGSWERYKWSEPDVDYEACEVSPEYVADNVDEDLIVR